MSTTPIDVLVTVSFADELLQQMRDLSPRLRLQVVNARGPEDISANQWEQAEVLYTGHILPTPEQAPNLRWIQFHYAGIDHVASAPILKAPNVQATTLSGSSAPQVAEYAVMMLIALGHRMPDLILNQQKAEWPRDRWERFRPQELRGATVGLVGYGSIGREVARLLQPFNVRILAAKRDAMHPQDTGYLPEGLGDPEGDLFTRLYPIQALGSMLKECDFVVVCVPLSPATRGLIGEAELAALKPTACLVDVSRGGVIQSKALLEALQEKKLAGAALDVFPEEPLPASSPFWKLPNVLISPHVSGISPHYSRRAAECFIENLKRYLAGTPLFNLYRPDLGY